MEHKNKCTVDDLKWMKFLHLAHTHTQPDPSVPSLYKGETQTPTAAVQILT